MIEADSRRHHSAWLDVQADHRGDLLLTAAGWRITRVNWHQLIEEPKLFVAAVKAFLRAAPPDLAAHDRASAADCCQIA